MERPPERPSPQFGRWIPFAGGERLPWLVNTPDLADGVLGLASALRASTALPRPLRELAVVTVGLETGAEYEVDHQLTRDLCWLSCRGRSSDDSSCRRGGL